MPEIIVTTRDGAQQTIDFNEGTTLMQALVEGGVDELLALCGGVCSCATCHVHIDPAFYSQQDPRSEDEDALLSGSEYKNDHSRLSCQVRLTNSLDGMRVTVAPED